MRHRQDRADLAEIPGLHPRMSATALAREFMTLYPQYPVIRVQVRPGEAYLAPTDNLVHDGSSVDMTEEDRNLTFLGEFLSAAKLSNDEP